MGRVHLPNGVFLVLSLMYIILNRILTHTRATRRSVVGWGITLQAVGRGFTMMSLIIFSNFPNSSGRTRLGGFTQPLPETEKKILMGSEARSEHKANILTAICERID
jgi:hypothetical protein